MQTTTLLPSSSIRALMLDELQHDVRRRQIWLGRRLSPRGRDVWPHLLADAILEGDPLTLARALARNGRMVAIEGRLTHAGPRTVWVPRNAAFTLAWDEFNRFVVRATCRRALELGQSFVVVHRVRPARNPRPESEALIGMRMCPADLLAVARQAPDGSLGSFPPRPGSGLSVRLAFAHELPARAIDTGRAANGVRWTEPPRAA